MKKTCFQSPAEDYVEKNSDWNQVLIPHPGATFEVKVGRDSMIGFISALKF